MQCKLYFREIGFQAHPVLLHYVLYLSDKPSKPGTPVLDDSDRDHIAIRWEPPKKDGGASIKHYDVERKDPKSDKWIKINKEPVMVG